MRTLHSSYSSFARRFRFRHEDDAARLNSTMPSETPTVSARFDSLGNGGESGGTAQARATSATPRLSLRRTKAQSKSIPKIPMAAKSTALSSSSVHSTRYLTELIVSTRPTSRSHSNISATCSACRIGA
eukprot:6191084-Pleurochrysis_carterae.AAC.3